MKLGSTIAILLVLASALGGCLGDAGDGDALDSNADTATGSLNETNLDGLKGTTMVYEGCSEQMGIFPFPADQAQVPDGFSRVYMDPAELTVPLVAIGYACQTGDEDVAELWGFLPVQAPDELHDPDAKFHLVPIGGFTSSEQSAEIYQAWGFQDMATGQTEVAVMADTPAARAGHVLGSNGDFTVHVYTSTQGAPVEIGGGHARVFAVQDNEVVGAMEVSWPEHLGVEDGEAFLQFEGELGGSPQPSEPGLGAHYWGEDFGYTLSYLDLDRPGASQEAAAR